jgi:hypothetical protein
MNGDNYIFKFSKCRHLRNCERPNLRITVNSKEAMPNVAVLVMGPAGAGKVDSYYLQLLRFIDDILHCTYGRYSRAEATSIICEFGSRS